MTEADRASVRDYYDAWGEKEWDRLVADVPGRVSFEVHRRFLRRFITPGSSVLEVGAGPGRFTIELAGVGARIDVTDYSPVQLELNAVMVGRTEAEESVRTRTLLDICDTSAYPDASFDAVVAFGGPLSYAFDEAEGALAGLFRILRPGGVILASVMSLLGSWRFFLPTVIDDIERAGFDAYEELLRTGDLRALGTPHICRLFRSREIRELVAACGGELLAMSASNWASLGDADTLARFESDRDQWAAFLDHEAGACAEPGALDGGTHLLFAARRVAASSSAAT
jgi:SAM-dependent methyltransferase